MSIVKMNKLSVIGLEDDRKSVFDILHKSGCLQITDAGELDDKSNFDKYGYDNRLDIINEFISDITKAREAIIIYDKRKKNIFEPLEMKRSTYSKEDIEKDPNKNTCTGYIPTKDGKSIRSNPFPYDTFLGGAGGILSSVNESMMRGKKPVIIIVEMIYPI